MVSKEALKLKEKARSLETAEKLASQGLALVDKELYDRQERKQIAFAVLFIVEIIVIGVLLYYAGRKDALVSCADMLVTVQNLARDHAVTACKTVTGW